MLPLAFYLMVYYNMINSGNTSPEVLRDYAVIEAQIAGVDPQKVLFTIEKESINWKVDINNHNDCNSKESKNCGCTSRGLVQIRNCSHPTVTDEQAYNPIFAVNFLIKNIDKCNTWWKGTCGKYKPMLVD